MQCCEWRPAVRTLELNRTVRRSKMSTKISFFLPLRSCNEMGRCTAVDGVVRAPEDT
jgi:hypothetical protein